MSFNTMHDHVCACGSWVRCGNPACTEPDTCPDCRESPRCTECGEPREPLLEHEMVDGGRGDALMCRACFAELMP